MSETVLHEERVRQWLEHFDEADRPNAGKLLALVKLVPGDLLREEITTLLERRLSEGKKPVALFNESERRMWKGSPNRLFEEETRANGKGIGQKTTRAEGKTGPALVPRQRSVDEKIGSEGVMANILTQFQKGRGKDVVLSPGPDTFRTRRIRRFILVTDFIGSGTRAETLACPLLSGPTTMFGLDLAVLTRYLVQPSCDLPGWFQLAGELGRGQVAEGRVRAVLVVVDPPDFDAGPRIAHG